MSLPHGHDLAVNKGQVRRERVSAILMLLYLVIVFMTGGSSRADEPAQIANHLAAILFGAVALGRIAAADLQRVRGPLLLFLALILIGALQLFPLPPQLWAVLPGHQELYRISTLSGLGSTWRPLSLTPDLTLDAIFSFVPPLAAILLLASVRPRHIPLLVAAMLLLILASALLGLLQAATGQYQLYGYRISGFAGANGLLANRNHQAALLACAVPLWTLAWQDIRKTHSWLLPVAITILFVFASAILATGSRAGLLLTIVATATTYWHFRSPAWDGRGDKRSAWKVLAAFGACAILAVVFVSPPAAVERLFDASPAQEFRFRLFVPLIEIGWQYFPFGSGLGSFVDVYKLHEHRDDLGIQYLNHAHNDLVEMFIEGGLTMLIVLGLAGAWVFRFVRKASREDITTRPDRLRPVGSIIVITLLVASLLDYPLRTPLMSVVFAIALCWLTIARPIQREA